MKKLIILSLSILPLGGVADEACCPATKQVATQQCPMTKPEATCPMENSAKASVDATCPISNLPPAPVPAPESQEMYDFSCMELLRLSILIQAEKEGIEKEVVANGIDKLGEDIIEANINDLMEVSNEIEADEAMMKLFKAKMDGKSLKEILEIK